MCLIAMWFVCFKLAASHLPSVSPLREDNGSMGIELVRMRQLSTLPGSEQPLCFCRALSQTGCLAVALALHLCQTTEQWS